MATLDDDSLVIQNPASASTTPAPERILVSDENGKIDNGWLNTGHGNGLDADLIDGQELSDILEKFEGCQPLHGFTYPYDASLSYDESTRKITLTPVLSSFSFWINGTRFIKPSTEVSISHPNSTGQYFFTYNASGQIEVSSSPWNLLDFTRIPICSVYFNQFLNQGFANFGLHRAHRNVYAHKQSHFSMGTFVKNPSSNFSLSGYVVQGSTASDVTFSVSSGTVMDEDIEWTISTLIDGGPYTALYRVGATEWRWTEGLIVPYLYNSGTNRIQVNSLSGGIFALSDLQNDDYVNYYIFATTALDTAKQIFLVPGQSSYTTKTAADAESVTNLNFASSVPLEEFAPLWKVTFRLDPAGSAAGRGSIYSVSKLLGTKAAITLSGAGTAHNSLSGRSDADSHPASAIAVTPSGDIVATNAQGAFEFLDTSKAPLIPKTDNAIDLGSPLFAFRNIYAHEMHLSTSSLYLGTTKILGTDLSTVEIKTDAGQNMLLRTDQGSLDIKTIGANANISLTANGASSGIQITSAASTVSITGTGVLINSPTTFSESVTVLGNLTVKGTQIVVDSTNMEVADNIIVANAKEVGSGVSLGISGIQIDRGTLTDWQLVFDESDDLFKVGPVGSLEAVATRNWSNSAFSPLSHGHSIADIANLQTALDGKAGTAHDHDTTYLALAGGSVTGLTSFSGGTKIILQNGVDGGADRGIYYWLADDTNWASYMASAGASKSISGGTACSSLSGATDHHIRHRSFLGVNRGFLWENSDEECLMSLTADTGTLYTKGSITTNDAKMRFGNTLLVSGLEIDSTKWYRVMTVESSYCPWADLLIQIPGGNSIYRVRLSKGTSGIGLGWTTEIDCGGIYNYAVGNIIQVRVVDSGTNASTHVDVKFNGNATRDIRLSILGEMANIDNLYATLVACTDQGTATAGVVTNLGHLDHATSVGVSKAWSNAHGGILALSSSPGNMFHRFLVGTNDFRVGADTNIGFLSTGSANPIGFYTSGVKRMNISATGGVTVGADTIQSGYLFQVNGSSYTMATQTAGVYIVIGNATDSGIAARDFGIYQAGGAWTPPYPDLCIAYRTGIRIGAHSSFGGTRFYGNSFGNGAGSEPYLLGVGDGANDVYIPVTLRFGTQLDQIINLYGSTYGIGVQNSTLYLRTASSLSFFQGGVHSDLANTPGSGGVEIMRVNGSGIFLDPANTNSGNFWFHSYGNSGWYNGTFGGGIYMIDTTWVRTYNGKGFSANKFHSASLVGTGNRAVYSDASGVLTNTASDRKLKKNIYPLPYGLETCLQLNPVLYQWKDFEKMGDQVEMGLIAQEVLELCPEVIGTNSDGALSLDYPKLVAVLINAIKELKGEINELSRAIAHRN